MKRTVRSLWFVALLGLLLSLPPASVSAATGAHVEQQPPATDDWARIREAGVITFGTAADYPPFEFYNSNHELDGFDIALAKALGETLGVRVEFTDFAFDGLLSALALGQVDAAIGAISVTPDRQALVDFTNLYYLGDSVALAPKTFTGAITSATDFAGLRVGVQRGATFQAWAQTNLVEKGVIPQEALIPYHSPVEMLRDMGDGAIDISLMGKLTADLATQFYPNLHVVGSLFNQQEYAIAVREDSTLTEPLNRALLALQSEGTFGALIMNYLQVRPDSVTPQGEAAEVETAVAPPTIAEPPCLNGMAFVADLNFDDKNMTAPPAMAPGQDFSKSWRVRNSGTCPWQPDFELVYVNGNRIEASMGGSSVPIGREVLPDATIDISASLRAPQTYGVFQGFWQMRDSSGQLFGEVLWVGIEVPDPNPPPPPPPPPPASLDPQLRADSAYIAPGQCTAIRWDVDNVLAVFFIEGGNEQGVGGHDARTVCPGSTATYVLRVVAQDGSNHDFPITITVTGAPDYSINFWADHSEIDAGQCTRLRWDVRNVQAVFIDGEGVGGVSDREVCPGGTRTWTLTAVKHDGGQESRQVTVHVRGTPPSRPRPHIDRFTTSANEIPRGKCVRLEWRTDDADSVNVLRNGRTIEHDEPGNGDTEDCPQDAGLYEYRLVAYGNGQAEQTVTVKVVGPQPR